mmetsp:Transcript_44537/g.94780  ORF Transcript_44537/g.94780 Transcript_44537/m.94780 type:complete len:351 (-) Transcript_44537:206-1258(-)|eukprot:CAMPEP_0172538334 /NCGR_PEP_ID=MMETSP1067-20121228/9733_1 /TAXON_ID=265564 ORGANISM="Thalassiosira punctigera, Strain Tpunct2005C2" /NCGR_SAMPLE_ID=MMETSP1067 /ASSEMBLY_ACC=CAM_ASM_000444 /LENGTH=350 /DNA_ID=CAMNT_0013323809 /DNA_START=160 /DNA_END=1212 /DNA_ORIENTATION=+
MVGMGAENDAAAVVVAADDDGGIEGDSDEEYSDFLAVLDGKVLPPAQVDADDRSPPTRPNPKKFGSVATQVTAPLSFGDFDDDDDEAPITKGDGDDGVIVYTDEELDAMRAVRTKLEEEHSIPPSRLGAAFLAVATINCKLRVDETVNKIKKLLEIMAQLGCPDGIDDELWKPDAKHELHPYPPVGKDRRGCRTTWIRGGGKVTKELERAHCHACIMQYLSVHSDPNTLRNGVTFVIDLSSRTDLATQSKQGNERLIQSFYQAIPQRPQIIMIAGCSLPLRAIVNASIKLASVFIKQKVLQRIHFVTVEDAAGRLARGSAPAYVGGMGGGVESYEDWVRERLERLLVPDL